MSIKKRFLTLSIRHQISFVISIIALMCLLFVLALFSLYANIITGACSRIRQGYFSERYKLIFDSQINFQNFLLYQYEQLLKLFNEQLYYYRISLKDFNESYSIGKAPLEIKDYSTINEENITSEEFYKYYISNKDTCDANNGNIDFTKNYIFLYNHLISIKNLRLLYLGIDGIRSSVLKDFILTSSLCGVTLSNSKTKINDIISDINNYLNKNLDNEIKDFLDDYKNSSLPVMDVFFPDKIELLRQYKNLNGSVDEYLNNISHYFTYIDYSKESMFSKDKLINFTQQYYISEDYINMIFLKVQNYLNINSIPVFAENNTILSKDLCFSFLYKQIQIINSSSNCDINQNKLEEIYNSLKVGETKIEDCILGEKYGIEVNEDVKVFVKNKKFDKYYSLRNIRDSSFIQLSDTTLGQRFIVTKYTFPDYETLIDFKSSFFTLEQINIFCFSSFHESDKATHNMFNFYYNIQYLIILLILYLWILIYIYLRIRLQRIYKEVIQPINDLNDVISQLDIREENQLKYESDDSINELFKLCNELLLGKYKKKLVHESELELEKIDNDKNNHFNNFKIDRKIIEEMIENKNKFNNVEKEIFLMSAHDKIKIKHNIHKKFKRSRKKLNTVMENVKNKKDKEDFINIDESIKRKGTVNEKSTVGNKKLSANAALFNNYENVMEYNKLYNKIDNDELFEMKSAMNYKNLYQIVNLIFDYDLEPGKIFIPKFNKLSYRDNSKFYFKHKKSKSKKFIKEENKTINDTEKSTINEVKDASNIKLEDFDRSVVNAYDQKNLLFIWYKQAKYYNNVEFLQREHDKELNDLCKIFNEEIFEKKKLSKNTFKLQKNKSPLRKQNTLKNIKKY